MNTTKRDPDSNECDGCGNEFGADNLIDGECIECNPQHDHTEPDDHELPALRRRLRYLED